MIQNRKKIQKTFGRRLRTQLLMVFMATMAVLVTAVALFCYKKSEKAILEQSAEAIRQASIQNRYNVVGYTEEIEKLMRLLMTQESLGDYMRRGWRNDFESFSLTKEIFEYTSSLMSNYEDVDSVYYYGSDHISLGVLKNRNLVRMPEDPVPNWYSLGIQENVSSSLGKIFWFGGYQNGDFTFGMENYLRARSGIDQEQLLSRPCVTAVMEMWLGQGKTACIVVNIKQEALARLFTRTDSPDDRENYIIDEKGTVIVDRDSGRVGKSAGFTVRELERTAGDYFMKENKQVNCYRIPELSWILISEISTDVLYEDLQNLRKWFLAFAIGTIAAAFALSSYSLSVLTAPLDHLRKAMERMENGVLGEQLDEGSRNELGLLGRQFNLMAQSIQDMIGQIRMMEKEKRILEKESLQAQLNPHFLFNTLSTMRFMAKFGQTEQLETCFAALGNMLQPMYRSEGELWSLGQELDYLYNYVTIMNCRFGGKLMIEFEIPEEFKEVPVLKFILQPLVENAVEHGFRSSKEEGMIVVGAQRREAKMEIYVEDNGSGICPEELEKLQALLEQAETQTELYRGHVGIVNVHRRLKVHFGEEAGVRIESTAGESTCIYLEMPYHNKRQENETR